MSLEKKLTELAERVAVLEADNDKLKRNSDAFHSVAQLLNMGLKLVSERVDELEKPQGRPH